MSEPLHALFLIEDTSFAFDSRVRRETRTLVEAGVEISVIAPAPDGDERSSYEDEGVQVYQYRVDSMDPTMSGHLQEYVVCLLEQTRLAAHIHLRRGFDVVHVGNPPDLLFLVALPYKMLGKKFIYDQHDLVPELFKVRFAKKPRGFRLAIETCERLSFKLADHVISINETCRQLATGRGNKRPEDVTIVRNGPRQADFPQVEPSAEVAGTAKTMVGYIGHINPQDDVQVVLEVAKIIRIERGRTDIGFVIVGSGTDWQRLVDLRDEWGLADGVLMPGRLPWKDALSSLSATSICIQPDLPSDFNNKVTMNKLMEYMMLGKAVATFDLPETRVTGQDAVAYAPRVDAQSMADTIVALADNPDTSSQLGRAARRRIDTVLGWQHQAEALLSVYRRLFPGRIGDKP